MSASGSSGPLVFYLLAPIVNLNILLNCYNVFMLIKAPIFLPWFSSNNVAHLDNKIQDAEVLIVTCFSAKFYMKIDNHTD